MPPTRTRNWFAWTDQDADMPAQKCLASPHKGKGKGEASVKNAVAEALDDTNAEASVLSGRYWGNGTLAAAPEASVPVEVYKRRNMKLSGENEHGGIFLLEGKLVDSILQTSCHAARNNSKKTTQIVRDLFGTTDEDEMNYAETELFRVD